MAPGDLEYGNTSTELTEADYAQHLIGQEIDVIVTSMLRNIQGAALGCLGFAGLFFI